MTSNYIPIMPVNKPQSTPSPTLPILPIPTPPIHIHSIQFHNTHLLLPLHKIPSLRLHIPSLSYTTRPVYSCSNPIIKLNKVLHINDKINVMHYNLKDNKNQHIWQIVIGQPGGGKVGEFVEMKHGAMYRILSIE